MMKLTKLEDSNLVHPYIKGTGVNVSILELFINYTNRYQSNDILELKDNGIIYSELCIIDVNHIKEGDFFEELTILSCKIITNNASTCIHLNRQELKKNPITVERWATAQEDNI